MKKAIVSLLLGLLLFQNSGRLIVLAWFKLDQPRIVQSLCVNRNQPQRHCNGKCVLARKMATAGQQEQAVNGSPLTEVWVFMVPSLPVFKFTPAIFPLETSILAAYLAGLPSVPIVTIFHPPCI